jgi:hypothetical protein
MRRVSSDRKKKYVVHGHVLISGALTLNLRAQSENEGVSIRNKIDAIRPRAPKTMLASIQTPVRATATFRPDRRKKLQLVLGIIANHRPTTQAVKGGCLA